MPANPLDWKGPEFLGLYLVMMVAAGIGAIALRWMLRLPWGEPPFGEPLNAYELAYLKGGPDRVVDAAVAKLYTMGYLAEDAAAGHMVSVPQPDGGLNEVERAVLGSVGTRATLMTIRRSARNAASSVAERLRDLGLAPAGRGLIAILGGVIPMGFVVVMGVLKVTLGVSRDKPVVFLVILTALSFVGLLLCCRPVFRSRRGDLALATANEGNAALRHVATHHGGAISASDLAFAVALFGIGALGAEHAALAAVMRWRPAGSGSSSGCGSGSSCGSSCGGGCGGGCGGCGS